MKKVLSIVAATAMLAIVACGPTAEEKAKAAEKAMQDSIAQADSAAAAIQAMEAELAPAGDSTVVTVDSTVAPAN